MGLELEPAVEVVLDEFVALVMLRSTSVHGIIWDLCRHGTRRLRQQQGQAGGLRAGAIGGNAHILVTLEQGLAVCRAATTAVLARRLAITENCQERDIVVITEEVRRVAGAELAWVAG